MKGIDEKIEFLLKNAGPSIKYRTRRDILGKGHDAEMKRLQEEILSEKLVTKVLSLQGESGGFGDRLHTAPSNNRFNALEVATKFLIEKGIEYSHPAIEKAARYAKEMALKNPLEMSNLADESDGGKTSASEMIIARVLVQCGKENEKVVKKQIKTSLESFRMAKNISNWNEVTEQWRGKFVFRKGFCCPCYYDLFILANTSSWRNEENLSMLVQSSENLLLLDSPQSKIYELHKNTAYSPAWSITDGLVRNFDSLDKDSAFCWFQRMEHLAKCGLARRIKYLEKQTQKLILSFDQTDDWISSVMSGHSFTTWSAYVGSSLETGKTKSMLRNDFLFRSLLILKYSKDCLKT